MYIKNIFIIAFLLLLQNNLYGENEFSKGIEELKSGNYKVAQELFIRGCNNNDAASCAHIGIMYSRQLGVERDFKKAYNFFVKSCDLDFSGACLSKGLMLLDGVGVPHKDINKSIKIFNSLCVSKEIVACQMEFYAYEQVYGKVKAKEIITELCTNGSDSYCQLIGKNLPQHKVSIKDEREKNFKALILKCDLYAEDTTCHNVGIVYLSNNDFKDIKKAKTYLKIACNVGHQKSCSILAGLIEKNQGRVEAIEYVRKQCREGNKYNCSILEHYEKSIKAEETYQRNKTLCIKQNAKSCLQIAKRLYDGILLDQNLTLSMDYYKKGCEYGESEACMEIASKYRSGIRTKNKIILEENKNESLHYYKKACALSSEKGCKLAKYFEKKIMLFQKKYKNDLPKLVAQCTDGVSKSCTEAAKMFERNKEYKNALKYYIAGCTKNSIVACSNAATIYAEGKGTIKKDLKRAIEYYHTGCILGGENECMGESFYKKKVLKK